MIEEIFRVFDAHTHAFPDKIAAKTMEILVAKGGEKNRHDGTIDGLKAYEAAGGADGFLLLPIATRPSSTKAVNEWAAEQRNANILAFGSIHPDAAEYEADLDYAVELGLKGIKLHPEYQEFFVDEERMFPIYEAIFSRGLPICFHAGADIGYPPPIRGDAYRLSKVLDAFPDGKVIAAHMGAYQQYDMVCECLAGRPNLWIDTSFAAERMNAEEITHLVRLHGSDRVLFGTDAPWASFVDAAAALLQSGLTAEELKAIFWDNAMHLLG